MKPVPHHILAISAAVGILLLSVTLPTETEKASNGQKNTPAPTLLEPSDLEVQGQSVHPGTSGAQFPFLLME